MKASMLRINDGFGQFQAHGYLDEPDMAKAVTSPSKIMDAALALPGITAAAPRANGFGLLANGERSFAAAVVGLDPVADPEVAKISTMIKSGRALSSEDDASIVLGEGLARNLRVDLGDPVTLLGSAVDGSVAADVLTLVGIFGAGVPELDRQIAQMPLSRFNETFFMDGDVHLIAVSGPSLPSVEAAEQQLTHIANEFEVTYLDWAELRPEVRQAISLDQSTAMLMYGTLVVVVVFVILNTLYMSVLERTREFGMLLALGMKPGQIGRMVWAEMIFLSLLGTGSGIILGIALTAYFQNVGIGIEGMGDVYAEWGLPSRFYPVMTLERVLVGPAAIVGSIALLGIIPYRRVLGLEPVKAMAS
jgi:ABC-type lipoprotein release transport system permease subunit